MPFLRVVARPFLVAAAAIAVGGVIVGLAVAGLPGASARPAEGGSFSASELGIEVSRSVGEEPAAAAPAPRTGPAPGSGSPDAGSMAAGPPVVPPTTAPEGTYVTPGERLGIAGCPLFPRDHAFHASIARLPVHPRSDAMVAAAGRGAPHLDAGFSAKPWQGARAGIPVNVADSRTSESVTVFAGTGAPTSDHGRTPVPPAPRFEGWPSMRWDKHFLVVDPATCTSHEMIGVTPPNANPFGLWMAEKVVEVDLTSASYRRGGTVKVSGVSMLAGMVRYDEVATGDIDHAIGMSIPNARAGAPVWPARGSDGTNPDPDAPPMGSWLRLREDVDLSALGPQAQVIARALRDHGAVVADTGGRWVLNGEPDVRWDDRDLNTLRTLTFDDFEVVDPTPMIVSRDSLRIR